MIQANKGVSIGIPRGGAPDTCPVRALEVWLKTSACEHGPVFRGIDMRGAIERRALHPDAVRQILRKRATLAGLALPRGERLSPHGLRAGFITQAYINGRARRRRSWTTRARRICGRCAAMCAGPSSSPTVPPACWGCNCRARRVHRNPAGPRRAAAGQPAKRRLQAHPGRKRAAPSGWPIRSPAAPGRAITRWR